jgi:hypothetical protein
MPRLIVVAIPGLLTACGGIAVVDSEPDPWSAIDGQAAPLPKNGSSPGKSDGDYANGPTWTGWWVRFPSYSAYPRAIAAIGEDVVLTGNGPAADLDLGSGLLAPEMDGSAEVSFLARISTDGNLVWSTWSTDVPYHTVVVDMDGRIHVASDRAVRVYNGNGEQLESKVFSENANTFVRAIAPTADGGSLVGIEADGELDLGDGPVKLSGPAPVTLLVRFDAKGHPVWWREITGPKSWAGIGESGEGHVLAVVSGGGVASLGDLEAWPASASGTFAFVLDGDGGPLASAGLDGLGATVAVATKEEGALLSSTVVGATPLWVNGAEVPHESMGPYEDVGVLLRLAGDGVLESVLWPGAGQHSVATGPARALAAASVQSDPLGLLWCANGIEPCDRYKLLETDSFTDVVTLTSDGQTAYMAGQVRLTPGGSLKNKWQLYLMKLSR